LHYLRFAKVKEDFYISKKNKKLFFVTGLKPNISIVAPLYNESETFPRLVERLNALMDTHPNRIEIVLINDGSKDNTPELMRQLALTDPRYHCVFLARNYGHQIALTAGLSQTRATDAIMVIDGDLQDPPELLNEMYQKYQEGYDVVYAVRRKRKENWFKRTAYSTFYRFLKSISYIEIPLDSGDFSLMSRRVVDILNKMPEESRYIRGMRSWIGFRQTGIEYERAERAAGESKYSIGLLIKLAYNGIFNFSEYPIKFMKRMGYSAIFISMIYFIITLFKKLIFNDVPQGFTAILFAIIFIGGLQLFFLGILGEYVLRIFFQVKGRPLFIIADAIENGTLSKPTLP
jgi:dolichol-phosphate mannosyltransferase